VSDGTAQQQTVICVRYIWDDYPFLSTSLLVVILQWRCMGEKIWG